MRPFRHARSSPVLPPNGHRAVAEPALGYEVVDFNQQPVNLYVTELTYCEPHWHEAAELIMWAHDRHRARLHPDPDTGLADDELSPLPAAGRREG